MSTELYTGFEGTHSKDITSKSVRELLLENEAVTAPLIEKYDSLLNAGVIDTRDLKDDANIYSTTRFSYNRPVIMTDPLATSKEEETIPAPVVLAGENRRDPSVGLALVTAESTLWLNETNITEAGGVVSAWGECVNVSGSPTYVTNFANGLPGVGGNQSNYLWTGFLSALSSQEFTIFSVQAPTVNYSPGITFYALQPNVPNSTFCYAVNSYNRHRLISGALGNMIMGSTSNSSVSESYKVSSHKVDNRWLHKPFQISYVSSKAGASNNGVSFRLNSIDGLSDAASNNGAQITVNKTLNLFRDACTDTSQAHGAIFGEVIFIPRRLTPEEVIDVETYLQDKWNLLSYTAYQTRDIARFGITSPITGATPRDGTKGTTLMTEATVHLKGEDLVDNGSGGVDSWGVANSKVGNPTYVPNFANGIPGVEVTKGNYLTSAAQLSTLSSIEHTIIAVVKPVSFPSNDKFGSFISLDQGPSTSHGINQWTINTYQDGSGYWNIDTFERTNSSSNAIYTRHRVKSGVVEPMIVAYKSAPNGRMEDDSGYVSRVNGRPLGALLGTFGGALSGGDRYIHIGNYNSTTATTDTAVMQVAEFIFIPRILTDEEIREVETTLSNKYNIYGNVSNYCLNFASRNLRDEAIIDLNPSNLEYTGDAATDWGGLFLQGGNKKVVTLSTGHKAVKADATTGPYWYNLNTSGLAQRNGGFSILAMYAPDNGDSSWSAIGLHRGVGGATANYNSGIDLRTYGASGANTGALRFSYNFATEGWDKTRALLHEDVTNGKFSVIGGTYPTEFSRKAAYLQNGILGKDVVNTASTPERVGPDSRLLILFNDAAAYGKLIEVLVFPKELTSEEILQITSEWNATYYDPNTFDEQKGWLNGRGAVLTNDDVLTNGNIGAPASPAHQLAFRFNDKIIKASYNTKNSFVDAGLSSHLCPNFFGLFGGYTGSYFPRDTWINILTLNKRKFTHTIKGNVAAGSALLSEATLHLNESNVVSSGGNVSSWGPVDKIGGVPTVVPSWRGFDGVQVDYNNFLYTSTPLSALGSSEYTLFIVAQSTGGNGAILNMATTPAPPTVSSTPISNSIAVHVSGGKVVTTQANLGASVAMNFTPTQTTSTIAGNFIGSVATKDRLAHSTVRYYNEFAVPTTRAQEAVMSDNDRYLTLGRFVNGGGSVASVTIIGEVIFIPRKLSNQETLDVEAYLKDKWGFEAPVLGNINYGFTEDVITYIDRDDGRLNMGRRLVPDGFTYHSGDWELLGQDTFSSDNPFYAFNEDERKMYPVQTGMSVTNVAAGEDTVDINFRIGSAEVISSRTLYDFTNIETVLLSWPSTPQGDHTNNYYTASPAMIDDLSVNIEDGTGEEGMPSINKFLTLTSGASFRAPTTTGFRGINTSSGLLLTGNAANFVLDADTNTKAEALSVGDEVGVVGLDLPQLKEKFKFQSFNSRKPVCVSVDLNNIARWTTDLGFSLETVVGWNNHTSDDSIDMSDYNLGGIKVANYNFRLDKKNLDTTPIDITLADLSSLHVYIKAV